MVGSFVARVGAGQGRAGQETMGLQSAFPLLFWIPDPGFNPPLTQDPRVTMAFAVRLHKQPCLENRGGYCVWFQLDRSLRFCQCHPEQPNLMEEGPPAWEFQEVGSLRLALRGHGCCQSAFQVLCSASLTSDLGMCLQMKVEVGSSSPADVCFLALRLLVHTPLFLRHLPSPAGACNAPSVPSL